MGYIELTYCGNWTKQPRPKTPFILSYRAADLDLVDDFFFIDDRFARLDAEERAAIASHSQVIEASLKFDDESDLKPAIEALKLTQSLMRNGGAGVFIDPASKIFSPNSIADIKGFEPNVLFHFLVEIYGDNQMICSSGMNGFGLPDVECAYQADDKEAAQAAVFGMAIKLVCGDFTPVGEGLFKNTESAPVYRTVRDRTPRDENQLGTWRLVPF